MLIDLVTLRVPGSPAPKGSRTPGRRKDGTIYTRPASKGEHPWVETVARATMQRVGQVRARGEQLPAAPYAVTLAFAMPRPDRPAHPWPTRGDVDKLARAVLDGLVLGGLLTDDRHVVDLHPVKRWAQPGGEGVEVRVSPVPPPSWPTGHESGEDTR